MKKRPRNDQLARILLKCGRYYRSAALFYQELWHERVQQIGFHVISVEKLDAHEMWVIRIRITASAQLHLLAARPPATKLMTAEDPFVHQLTAEVRALAGAMGPPIRADYLTVTRTGAYCALAFIWPRGRPGRLLRKEKITDAFSFFIKAWLKAHRN